MNPTIWEAEVGGLNLRPAWATYHGPGGVGDTLEGVETQRSVGVCEWFSVPFTSPRCVPASFPVRFI